MYYIVVKSDGHLRARAKRIKHEPQASVFLFLECSQMPRVLSQYNTLLKLLHLLYDIDVMWQKDVKRVFSLF